jgi:hypothetical protein
MFPAMSNDAFFAYCGELLGRWTAAFTEGLRRGRDYKTKVTQIEPAPRRMCTTSDPDMHPN